MVHSQGDDAGALLLCDRTEKKAFLRDLISAKKLIENGYFRVSVHFVNDSSLFSSYTLNGKDMVFRVEITIAEKVLIAWLLISTKFQVTQSIVIALKISATRFGWVWL